MATRNRHHLPPLELLVLFIFDHGPPSVWIMDLATGEATRTTGGIWQADRRTNPRSDRAVSVHVCALNPPEGTSLWLRSTSSGDYKIDAPAMSFELANASHADGMRFTLAAGDFPITLATGDAAKHSDWYPDLTILPRPDFKPKGPKPPPLIPTPPTMLDRFIQELLTSPPVIEHVQKIIDDRIARPDADHRSLREELAALANGRLAPALLEL